MTSPVNVGSVEVEVIANASKLAKSLRQETEKAFRSLDLGKLITASVSKTPIKVPVSLDPQANDLPEKVKKTRIPKVPVEVDPVLQAFQQEVRRQTAALARQVIKLPVDGDLTKLRAGLATQLAEIKAQSRIEVPTEPGDKATYEARLRAQLAEVARHVKQNVEVDIDVDKGGSVLGKMGSFFKGLGNALPDLGGFSTKLADVGGAMQKLAGTSAQLGGSLVGAFTTATGPAGIVIGALIAAAGAAAAFGTAIVGGVAFAIPAVTALAGALASIPGLLAGAGAAVGTLALGFKGIGSAFQDKPGGGGGGGVEDPASRARRIAGAERGVEAARRGIGAATRGVQTAERAYDDAVRRVAEAQRRAQQAQEAVNRARREAREEIEDLNRELAGARLSEEDAALRVTEALRELNAARESGNLPDIQRADLEYRQAQQSLTEAKDATEDLGQAAEEAHSKGIDGSDKVRDALEDQRDAIQGVADAQRAVVDAQNGILSANDALAASYDGLASAQDSLAEAQKKAAAAGGGGGAVADVVKLAPNAQKFVDAIKALKPAFEDLRLDVQQRLFAGLDTVITGLADKWKNPLKRIFGGYADTFNEFFKNLGGSLGTPKFIDDIEKGTEGFRKGLDKILDAVSGPLVEAFGSLAAASAPFTEALGTNIARIVTKFSEWVKAGEQSGALQEFMSNATDALNEIFKIGESVASIIGSIVEIIAGKRIGGKGEKTPLQSFREGLDKVADWLDDPQNQQKIRDFISDVSDAVKELIEFGKNVKSVIEKIQGVVDKVQSIGRTIKEALGIGDKPTTAGGGVGAAAAAAVNPEGSQSLIDKAKESGRNLIQGLFDGMKEKLGEISIAGLLWDGPNSLIGKMKAGLGIASPSRLTIEMGEELINGLVSGMGAQLQALVQKAQQLPGRIIAGIGRTGSLLVQRGRDAVTGLMNGIGSLYGSLAAKAGTLKSKITGAVRGAASWLFDTGYNTVIGLWNGISSLGGWLWRKVADFARENVKEAFKDALGIASPSKVAIELGREVPAGFAIGLNKGAPEVQSAVDQLADIASLAADTTFPGLGADLDAAVSNNLAIAGSHTFVLDFAPGFTGDFLVDGLKRNIKARNNGNVQAALGS